MTPVLLTLYSDLLMTQSQVTLITIQSLNNYLYSMKIIGFKW